MNRILPRTSAGKLQTYGWPVKQLMRVGKSWRYSMRRATATVDAAALRYHRGASWIFLLIMAMGAGVGSFLFTPRTPNLVSAVLGGVFIYLLTGAVIRFRVTEVPFTEEAHHWSLYILMLLTGVMFCALLAILSAVLGFGPSLFIMIVLCAAMAVYGFLLEHGVQR